jgi:hypothetical protein
MLLQDLRDLEQSHTFFTRAAGLYAQYWGEQHVQTALAYVRHDGAMLGLARCSRPVGPMRAQSPPAGAVSGTARRHERRAASATAVIPHTEDGGT